LLNECAVLSTPSPLPPHPGFPRIGPKREMKKALEA